MRDHFDLVLVGTGFASSFFLLEYLGHAAADTRVLVLERGARVSHGELSLDRTRLLDAGQASFVNKTAAKPWQFSLGFGGSSNCWGGTAPRLLPEDFRLRSLYGVGRDWPIGYDDLEEYYCRAEEIMAVAGPRDGSPAPRSRPYPQPPHRFSAPDELFKAAFPDQYFQQPAARPTVATPNRPRCCASGVCTHCPIDSKFTVSNELAGLYRDPRVRLKLGARVTEVRSRGNVATAVEYVRGDTTATAAADLVGLGAHAIHNPFILLRSGLDHPELGRNLHEQAAVVVNVNLRGLDNFQGSSIVGGVGYMLYPGPHRRQRAAALMASWNVPQLRDERGKWRHFLTLNFVFEDLPQPASRVVASPDDPGKPEVSFGGRSAYTMAGIAALESELPRILAPLPVENFSIVPFFSKTESHILGTTVMGTNPEDSIVDADLVHHRVRNLVVLGSGAFPTASPSHPTLTLAALSLRAAERLAARRARA